MILDQETRTLQGDPEEWDDFEIIKVVDHQTLTIDRSPVLSESVYVSQVNDQIHYGDTVVLRHSSGFLTVPLYLTISHY